MSIIDMFFAFIDAWKRWRYFRFVIAFIIFLVVFALVVASTVSLPGDGSQVEKLAGFFGAIAAVFALIIKSYLEFLEELNTRKKISTVEEKIRENPEQSQLAWELAQTKLESYLNRNLSQVRSIFWLTTIVMLIGFGFILFGVMRAFDAPEKLPVAIVASVSGVLISFIGGSFLIVYRSTLAQSKGYVSVLERINAVGMAVQVLETIPSDAAQLKNETTAEIAKQLLRLYSAQPTVDLSEKNGE